MQGKTTVRVLLEEDCLGVPSSSLDATTCIDANHRAAPLTSGLETISDEKPKSLVGTWKYAVEKPCSAKAPEGQVCIPGGFSILGELSFDGVSDGSLLEDSTPLRAVRLSPFYMDKTEFTVARLRGVANLPSDLQPIPPTAATPGDPLPEFCTYSLFGNDDKPVNCISWEGATAACAFEKGTLPSEAQWEHAARGRGQRRLYPWGQDPVVCCAASASRLGLPVSEGGPEVECGPAAGIESVGSHPPTTSCGGIGDVSRDGVVDMAGSVSELMLDQAASFDSACWDNAGIPLDPNCAHGDSKSAAVRGGYWNGGLAVTLTPLRRIGPEQLNKTVVDPGLGFRCVYPDAGAE
jgi:formylglycine-generating enzyme required for sulfatase activity